MTSLVRRRFLWAVALTVLLTGAGVLIAGAWGGLIAAPISLAVGWRFSSGIVARLGRFTRFAGAAFESGQAPLTEDDPSDEFGALADSLNRMSRRASAIFDQMKEESARQNAILATMREGVLAVDHRLQVVFCNEAFANAVQVDWPVATGRPLRQITRDVGLIGMIERVQRDGEAVQDRLLVPGSGGKTFEVHAIPLRSTDHGGVLTILHEITELERLERVRQDFVANVSHELRTPLTAILGYSETLLEGALSDPDHNREFVRIIRSHAMRLTNIAEDLLRLARLDTQARSVEREPVPLRAAVEGAVRMVEFDAHDESIRLMRGEIPDVDVAGDRVALEQAFLNLLTNAVKFNRPGGEVSIAGRVLPGEKVQVTVRDTGIGIASEHLSRIFERFYRVDKARSREVGGTGLGLSIVKHAVENLGGTVAVESQLGKGTSFTVVLPINRSAIG